MSKNKLAKFAEMETFDHVVQHVAREGREAEHPLKGHWNAEFFRNNGEIILELGCGRGEYTVELARQNPAQNYIGVDIKGARMWAGAKQSKEMGLRNVGFLRTNIEIIGNFFGPQEVRGIWLTFSDPQMKKATKRLTSTYFMKRYRAFLADGGWIKVKTDSPFLYTYTCEMAKVNHLEIIAQTDDLYGKNAPGIEDEVRNIKTYYEKQWLERGKTIKYIAFRLPLSGELTEPEIDIERDDYRSFGRNGRGGKTTPHGQADAT